MRPHVLAVSSNPELGRMLIAGLPLYGFQAGRAGAGEAQAAAGALPPDAILLDMGEDLTGPLALCEQLRSRAKLAEVPILFITTDTRAARWIDVLIHGGDDLILLPVPFPLLADRLRFHINLARERIGRRQAQSKTRESSQEQVPVERPGAHGPAHAAR